MTFLPNPMSWREYLIWVWKNQPRQYREPARPVAVKPPEPAKAKEPVQERFL